VYGGYLVLAEPVAGLEAIRADAPQREVTLNWLNVFYAIEWVLFAGFAIYLWYRLVRDAVERAEAVAAP
jgi:surfeit locus 1 family protein